MRACTAAPETHAGTPAGTGAATRTPAAKRRLVVPAAKRRLVVPAVLRGAGWLRVAIVVGCGCYATAASASCSVVGLGGAMSLLLCSGSTRGTMTDLGNGLSAYRLSNGASGIFNLNTSATSANASLSPAATSATTSTTASGLTVASTTTSPSNLIPPSNGTAATELTVPSGGTVFFLANGTAKSVQTPIPGSNLNGVVSTQIPLNAPLTPPMSDIANSGIATPAPQTGQTSAAPMDGSTMPAAPSGSTSTGSMSTGSTSMPAGTGNAAQ